ncbi:hypothetical protein [Azoarcus sp. DN11]|uniref:hypothetical protein n=1 Tax=Azoarcus sp. DN11 TaxID=356837 RepID=UPI000EB3E7EF|nr:hypothetical protein [Azoarcus sp. DN11]AYH41922.1 hypothetical protein CDA09_00735 [Azoarcus sp. DN11]
MKSQDVYLLLKLVSLSKQEQQERDDPFGSKLMPLEAWRDWSDEDESHEQFDLGFPSYGKGPDSDRYSVRSLSVLTGISKSEISNALNRCYQSGLAKISRDDAVPTVNTRALRDFIIYGIRYVFPAKMQEMTRGIATGLMAPVFGGELRSAGQQIPVWPDPRGNTSGLAVEPLFKTVTMAVRKDRNLYILLALVDSIRLGLPRERNLAIKKLEDVLRD